MIGTIISLIGIIFTLLFGLYAIWAYKKNKKNVSLEFRNRECYSLFRDDVNRLNIQISYNNRPLSNTLILLKAKLLNNGKIDIDKNRIYKPLRIKTTSDFKWLESTITSKPDGSKTKVELINEGEVQIEWDLLKKGEFIEIEAVAEIVNNEGSYGEKAIDFFNGISFDYRITDLCTIQKDKLAPERLRVFEFLYKIGRVLSIFLIISGILFLIISFLPSLDIFADRVVKYQIVGGDSPQSTFIYPKKNNKIILDIEGIEEKMEVSIEEFNNKYKIKKVEELLVDPKMYSNIRLIRLISIVLIVFGVIYLFFFILKKQKIYKRYSKIANIQK